MAEPAFLAHLGTGWPDGFRIDASGAVEKASGIDSVRESLQNLFQIDVGSEPGKRTNGSVLNALPFEILPQAGSLASFYTAQAFINARERGRIGRLLVVEREGVVPTQLRILMEWQDSQTGEVTGLVFPFYTNRSGQI